MGHADLPTQKFANDALDGSAAEDREGMAAVGGDDAIRGSYAMLEPDGDRFL